MQDLENRNYTPEEILVFVQEQTGNSIVKLDADIFADLGCTGPDFTKLVNAFARTFDVNTSSYLWYFHTNEEEATIGSMFFKPPYERVSHIAVTPQMLLSFANSGYWDIAYPPHEIPSSRADILINILIVFAIIFLLIYVARKT